MWTLEVTLHMIIVWFNVNMNVEEYEVDDFSLSEDKPTNPCAPFY